MKGVSEIIAIILILMIVIALAALAYTWFSGIFSSLTATAGTSVTQSTNAMASEFTLDTVKGTGGSTTVSVTLRNTGTQAIDKSTLGAYVNDGVAACSGGTCSGTISPGGFSTVTFTATSNCACASNVCSFGGVTGILKLTISSGLQQSATIVC